MAEKNRGSFTIEIPNEESKMIIAMEHHPLTEISQSPGHLLLLKLLQREEHLFARKIATKETRIHSISREISHLCTSYLFFHGLFFILLFTSSINGRYHVADWWIPSLISLSMSLAIIFIAQVKLIRYWKCKSRLEKEKCENRAVGRRAMELRMKGASFDLSEEPNDLKRKFKSSSVEIKWGPVAWCRKYGVTVGMLCFSGLMFPASKLILCVI